MRTKYRVGSWIRACLFALLALGATGRAQADGWVIAGITQPTIDEFAVTGSTLSITTIDFDCSVYFWPTTPAGQPTYDWDWGDGTTHAFTKSASHSYATAGAYTVTLTATHPDYGSDSDSKTIYAIGGDFACDNLTFRWYGGEPVQATYKANCSAPVQPAGVDYSWFSYSGRICAESGQGTRNATMSAETGGAAPVEEGIGSEVLRLAYHRYGLYDFFLAGADVRRGQNLVPLGRDDGGLTDKQGHFGYRTVLTYMLKDQFADPMGNAPSNEWFENFEYDWQPDPGPQRWPIPYPSGQLQPTSLLADTIEVFALPDWVPSSLLPGPLRTPPEALGNEKVMHTDPRQRWSVGSVYPGAGVLVMTDVLQYYRDHGDHLDRQP